MIHRLACGQGLEVHAVGIVDEIGRGHLFLGHSGAGKSTTARLWLEQPEIRILSDDRIVLRRQRRKNPDVRNAVARRRGNFVPAFRRRSTIFIFWNNIGSNEIVTHGAGALLLPNFLRAASFLATARKVWSSRSASWSASRGNSLQHFPLSFRSRAPWRPFAMRAIETVTTRDSRKFPRSAAICSSKAFSVRFRPTAKHATEHFGRRRTGRCSYRFGNIAPGRCGAHAGRTGMESASPGAKECS